MSGHDFDAISTVGAHDVIVDHCTLTWATDENLSASGPRFSGDTPAQWRAGTSQRITFSNNLIAEGLAHATHKKGEHSKGSLLSLIHICTMVGTSRYSKVTSAAVANAKATGTPITNNRPKTMKSKAMAISVGLRFGVHGLWCIGG